MHGIQMLLVIGGMALLGLLSLTFYRTVSSQNQNSVHNSVIIDATSIGQTLMSEIETKAFDAATIDSLILLTSSLTSPSFLGPETGEVYPHFNDIDDYNNYVKVDTIKDIGVFRTKVKVRYVKTMIPDVVVNYQTFSKAVYISVASPYTSDSTCFTRIFSY
jgi:hypothetical protein